MFLVSLTLGLVALFAGALASCADAKVVETAMTKTPSSKLARNELRGGDIFRYLVGRIGCLDYQNVMGESPPEIPEIK